MTQKARFSIAAALSSAALCTALVAMPAVASDYAIAEAGGEVMWSTNKAFGTAKLVVTGPDGYLFERTFAEGETPSVDLFAEDSADGGYYWSLMIVSKISDSLREEMDAARAAGDDAFLRQLKADGLFSSESHSGHFVKDNGRLIMPELSQEVEAIDDSEVGASAKAALPNKAQVFTDDLIVKGSQCLGFNCGTSESFGFDTLRLKEANLRIHFDDISTTGTFPYVDWRMTANGSNNGDPNYFSISDATNNKTPFYIEANSPNDTLRIASTGRVGVQTDNPIVLLHTKDGNTPTLRLEQDGSDGFQSYVWDLAGNETNFFVRDVTNSSKLPFRIKPGASDNSIFIDEQGRTGFGSTDNGPDQDLHLRSTDGDGQFLVQETGTTGGTAQRALIKLENNGTPTLSMQDTSVAGGLTWSFSAKSEGFEISKAGTNTQEFVVDNSGNVVIAGTFITSAGGNYPDYVFRDGYDLMTLDEVEAFIETNGHLPNVQSEEEVEFGKRVDISRLSISLLEKVEELTLYTIEQHKVIKELKDRVAALEGGND